MVRAGPIRAPFRDQPLYIGRYSQNSLKSPRKDPHVLLKVSQHFSGLTLFALLRIGSPFSVHAQQYIIDTFKHFVQEFAIVCVCSSLEINVSRVSRFLGFLEIRCTELFPHHWGTFCFSCGGFLH